MYRLPYYLISAFLLSGCSNFSFTSNVDKDNFDTYFKPSEVKIYSKEQLQGVDYDVTGSVEGSSCQLEENDRPADIKEARTKARIHAADINANGLIIQSCITFKADDSCLSNIICYGQAISITQENN